MTYNVLFVDDEPENLVVFESACADRFPVLTARTAKEGLELMRTHEVAVVLADQRMPAMTGLELLERVQVEFPSTVRMLVTAYSDLTTAVDAINRGQVRRYLKKPWDHDELRSTLSEAVDYYQMMSKLCQLERRMLVTERVYSLGVITGGLARELKHPAEAMGAALERARTLVRSVAERMTFEASHRRAEMLDADEELSEAIVCARRMTDIVRGLEVPVSSSDAASSNPSELLRLTLRMMQAELKTSVSLSLDVRTVPSVHGTSSQVGHVVLNLLVLALDAMAKLPREQRGLFVSLVHQEPWVVLSVGDTGPGIPAQAPERLFDPFSPAGRARGTGLGLAICKRILDEIGGKLDGENREGGGALFRAHFRRSRVDS